MGSHTRRVSALVVAFVLAGLLTTAKSAHPATETDAGDAGNWTMAAKDYAGTRFSPLDQVTSANVKSLTLAWTFSTGVLRGHEAAPLVVDDTMYIVTPYPNFVYALDLRQPGAPLKWKFSPKPAASSMGVACCDGVNRGAVYSAGRLYFNTLDNQTIALDARSGAEKWRSHL